MIYHSLAYLTALGDSRGVAMALKVLEAVKNNPEQRLALMLPLGRAAQRNFKSVADCRKWLKDQEAAAKEAGKK